MVEVREVFEPASKTEGNRSSFSDTKTSEGSLGEISLAKREQFWLLRLLF